MKHINKNINIKKRPNLGIGVVVCLALCVIFVIFIVISVTNNLANADTFGIGKVRYGINGKVGIISDVEYQNADGFEASQTSLASFSTRDISTPLSCIAFRVDERNRIIAEQQRALEIAQINNLKNKQNDFIRNAGFADGLAPIDYDCGKAAFIATWTDKINKYFVGTNLAGYGEKFATAAWDKGVDPRWSPAISNTESSKGACCFAPHNAWGWGNAGWDSWEQAIDAHVEGLAQGYPFSITRDAASTYCPPNSDNWFNNTLSEMRRISSL